MLADYLPRKFRLGCSTVECGLLRWIPTRLHLSCATGVRHKIRPLLEDFVSVLLAGCWPVGAAVSEVQAGDEPKVLKLAANAFHFLFRISSLVPIKMIPNADGRSLDIAMNIPHKSERMSTLHFAE